MFSSAGLLPNSADGVDTWLGESRAAARSFVYAPEIMEPITLAVRSNASAVGRIDLSDDYLQAAGRLAQNRAWQASTRLARMLSIP